MVHSPIPSDRSPSVGLLLSGGLDSSILLTHLLDRRHRVQPFYIRSKLVWEPEELAAVRRLLLVLDSDLLRNLVTLDLPLDDLYGDHWSITGTDVPDAFTPDDAVYLPGRNALLIVKAALWCQQHELEELALATVLNNPFDDARSTFFEDLQSSLNGLSGRQIFLSRPFAHLGKRQVMQLGRNYPLELTFSCLLPQHGLHCGQCNKCAERQRAFASIQMVDPTKYAIGASSCFA